MLVGRATIVGLQLHRLEIVFLAIQSTPSNSNLPLTRSNFEFPSDHFQYNFTLDNSNFFLFPSKVRIIGSRL